MSDFNIRSSYFFIFFLVVFSPDVLSITLNDSPPNKMVRSEKSNSNILLNNPYPATQGVVDKQHFKHQDSNLFDGAVIRDISLSGAKKKNLSSQPTPYEMDETAMYLFDQQELNDQKPSLELYQTLSPMLTPEMKKEAKKVLFDTAELREILEFSNKESETQTLGMQESSHKMKLLQGKALPKASNKYQMAANEQKEPDKTMVRKLFDGIYDLIKNALLIIVTILIMAKLISLLVKKVLKRKHRKKSRKKRRRRRRRRRTYA